MDLYICGIIDIVLVIGAILFFIIGYKKGFIKKIISLAGILVVLIFSFIYCGQFAQFLIHHDVFYPDIYQNINTNILTNLEGKNIAADATVVDVLVEGLNVPRFIANLIGNGVMNQGSELPTAAAMADAIAQYLSTTLMSIIAFFILAVGIFVITLILKLIASVLRTNKLVRFVDGILGSLLYVTIFACIVCVIFCILSYFMDKEWFSSARQWLEVDMQLNTDKFRISKFVYNGNILKRFLDLFFN